MENSLKFFGQRKNMKNIAQFANPMKILQGLRKSQNTLQKFHNLVKIHYENIAKISQPCKNALRKCPVKILANTEKPCEIFDRVAKRPTVTPHLFKPPPMLFFFSFRTPHPTLWKPPTPCDLDPSPPKAILKNQSSHCTHLKRHFPPSLWNTDMSRLLCFRHGAH